MRLVTVHGPIAIYAHVILSRKPASCVREELILLYINKALYVRGSVYISIILSSKWSVQTENNEISQNSPESG